MKPDFTIACATKAEMLHFLERYPADQQQESATGISVFTTDLGRTRYDILVTGPGVFNTIHSMTQYLETHTPQMILNTGIAGAFNQSGLKLKDIAVAESERYIHAGVENDSPVPLPLPFELLPGCKDSATGRYRFDPLLVDSVFQRLVSAFSKTGHFVKKGKFITVSTITATDETAKKIFGSFLPLAEAMEGAACAHVAALYNIPFIEVRSISNFVGRRDRSNWEIKGASEQLTRICETLLQAGGC